MNGAVTQEEKDHRDAVLAKLTDSRPYNRTLGVEFTRMGDELTGRLKYDWKLIGNPALPALHGGVVGAFLEITAQTQLSWDIVWAKLESGGDAAAALERGDFPALPKTINLTIDYLRSGRPRDAYARAWVHKLGRRVANVRVEAWQDARDKPIASAHGHFLMPAGEE